MDTIDTTTKNTCDHAPALDPDTFMADMITKVTKL